MKKLFGLITSILFLALLLGLYTVAQTIERIGLPDENLPIVKKIYVGWRLHISLGDLFSISKKQNNQILFTVHPEENISSIANRLLSLGVIIDDSLFTDYLVYSGKDRSFRSGIYWIEPGLNLLQIANIFQDLDSKNVIFGVLPGWRAEEIAALLPSSGLKIDPNTFLEKVFTNEVYLQIEELNTLSNLEGFLFPGKYRIPREASAEDLISILTGKFWEEAGYPFLESIKNQALTLQEAVILASIIQRETVVKEEAPLIASVFLNRLRAGIPLQSDPTVQYALGFDAEKKTWWRVELTSQDLLIDSHFNTYIYKGLPPHPICNPDTNLLLAVAFPATSNFYYFRAACDNSGQHLFSETYADHLKNACN